MANASLDDDNMSERSRGSASFSEASNSIAPVLRRQSSHDSMSVMSAVTSNGRDSPVASGVNDDGWGVDNLSTLRPLHSSAVSGHNNMQPYEPVPFEKPEIGLKTSMSIMGDLSRGVERLKQDLFVIKFCRPEDLDEHGKRRRLQDEDEGQGCGQVGDHIFEHSTRDSSPVPASPVIIIKAATMLSPLPLLVR